MPGRRSLEHLQTLIESDRAAIHHRLQASDETADDLSANRDPLLPCREPYFDVRPWKQSQRRINERAARGDIHETSVAARDDPGGYDAMVVGGTPSAIGAPLGVPDHRGLQAFARASYLRMRVRAVSP